MSHVSAVGCSGSGPGCLCPWPPRCSSFLPLQPGRPSPFWIAGLTLVAAGEALRLWSVHHIGAISRTRSDRLGPLVAAGPFALVRNPLYIGNIALWAGFAVTAQLLWLTPAIILLLALEYHAIVRWEEELLAARLGDAYREYARRVRRWLPSSARPPLLRTPPPSRGARRSSASAAR